MATDKKEMWANWTRDATSRYVIPDDIKDVDELIDDMVEVATGYADQMLDEFEERVAEGDFGGGNRSSARRPAGRGRGRGRGRAAADTDEEQDPDDRD